jgi:ketosteroid isomerase-like protein
MSLMLASFLACGGGDPNGRFESPSGVSRGSDLLAEVMEADRVFAREVAANGLEAWVSAFAQDGAMLPASGPVLVGHEAVREAMASAFQIPGFSLAWEPLGGAVSQSGDLAYTFGNYEHKVDSEVVTRGRYVTVWRRQADGQWRVVADIGNREQQEE